MTVAKIMKKMIDFSEGNLHDINHFLKVYVYAKTIGELENLDAETQFILEIAAITHDIACPLCREKYGNTHGKYQEQEGEVLVQEFFSAAELSQELSPEQVERVAFLVGHHHTLTNVQGLDYQILVEADYLVNADESGHSRKQMESAKAAIFKTKSGISLLKAIYGV